MTTLSFAAIPVMVLSCFLFSSSANFASAQQMPVEFLEMMASNKPKLTPEQATQVAGVYNSTSFIRLGGDSVDRVLEAALDATATGEVTGDLSSLDFDSITAAAINDSAIVKFYSIWISHIDPDTGFFYAYRQTKSAPNSAGVSFTVVKRFVGAAMGRPDGSVLLVASNDQDPGIWQGLYKNDTIYMNNMEGIELWDSTGAKLVDDHTVYSVVLEKVALPEDFLNILKAALPLQVNKEGHLASAAPARFTSLSGIFAALLAVIFTVC